MFEFIVCILLPSLYRIPEPPIKITIGANGTFFTSNHYGRAVLAAHPLIIDCMHSSVLAAHPLIIGVTVHTSSQLGLPLDTISHR